MSRKEGWTHSLFSEPAIKMGEAMALVPRESSALATLRTVRSWSQRELADAAGVRPATISDLERGKKVPTLRQLERMAGIMGFPPATVARTLAYVDEARQALGPASPGDLAGRIGDIAGEFSREMEDFLRTGLTRLTTETMALQERCRATFLWERLRGYGTEERRAVIQESEDFRSWALCELLCEESEKAAADSPGKALELAGLALTVAGRVPGEAGWRSCLQGYAWAFLGNARRVGGDLHGADEAFARSAELWQAGALAGPKLLDESRLLDLEASLRREQRYLPEALALLDLALAVGGEAARGRILIKKAKTLEELADYEGAVLALRQAAPRVDREGDPRLFLCLQFNLCVNLYFLGRPADAAPLLPEVFELTARLGNDLDGLRLRWLEGRIAAGLGRAEEAADTLRQVRAEFASRGIAYDMALATLELSALLLTQPGKAPEVKALARHMAPVFQAQGVHREALAALAVFRKAAEEETLTGARVQEILSFLYRAQKNPDLRFESGEEPPHRRESAPPRLRRGTT